MTPGAAIFLVGAGMVMTVSVLVILQRVFHWKLLLGYATQIDVLFHIVLWKLYAGTFTGLFAATIAGLVMAAFLSLGRAMFGYKKLVIRRKGFRVWCEYRDYESSSMKHLRKWTKAVIDKMNAQLEEARA